MKIEIVVYNIESALRAQEGGADRIELCDNPGEGGTTPSYGTIELVRQNVSMDVYVRVRPRGGDYFYSSYDFHSMKRDISQCQKLSVDGISFGILNPEGTIDKKRCKELIAQARPLKITCHGVFDGARDPFEALEDCIEAGFDRILTAVQPTRGAGADLVAELIRRSKGKIIVVPGSGIDENTVNDIVATTGAAELHFDATAFRQSAMIYRNPSTIASAHEGPGEYSLRVVDPIRVKKIRDLAIAAQNRI